MNIGTKLLSKRILCELFVNYRIDFRILEGRQLEGRQLEGRPLSTLCSFVLIEALMIDTLIKNIHSVTPSHIPLYPPSTIDPHVATADSSRRHPSLT